VKQGIFIAIIFAMLGWAAYDFWQGQQTTGDKTPESIEVGLQQGNTAPEFKLETMDGDTVHLSDFKGEPVIVNFWATWCPPCRAEIPDLQNIHDAEEAVVLAVNMTESEQNEETVAEFADELQMTFPILMDRKSDVMDTYQVQAYPTSYVIDNEGRIAFVGIGAMNEEQFLRVLVEIK
jgi:peroxiredoxin